MFTLQPTQRIHYFGRNKWEHSHTAFCQTKPRPAQRQHHTHHPGRKLRCRAANGEGGAEGVQASPGSEKSEMHCIGTGMDVTSSVGDDSAAPGVLCIYDAPDWIVK